MAKDRYIFIGGGGNDAFAAIGSLLALAGIGVGGYLLYQYLQSQTEEEPEPECVVGEEIRCINGFEYECIGGELKPTGEPCLAPECAEGATECNSETLTIWECIDGEWADTGVSCAPPPDTIDSVSVPFYYEGTTLPVVGMKCVLALDGVVYGSSYTDAKGVAKFYNVPLGFFTLAVSFARFHIQDYDTHLPFADYKYIDLRQASYYVGKDYVYPYPTYMLKNVPSAEYTKAMWLPTSGEVSGADVYITGATGGCRCTSLVGCNHPWVRLTLEVRNRWNEPIQAQVGVYQFDTNRVCFTPGAIDCDVKAVATGDQYRPTDSQGHFECYVWASDNGGDFRQQLSIGPYWNDPVTGALMASSIFMYFRFYHCTISSYSCYERNQDLNNAQCGG